LELYGVRVLKRNSQVSDNSGGDISRDRVFVVFVDVEEEDALYTISHHEDEKTDGIGRVVVLQDFQSKNLELREVRDEVVIGKGIYEVGVDILVLPSGVLRIEPGAQFYFGEGCGILCYGTLLAEGSEEQKIVFSARHFPDRWANLAFVGKASARSVLRHCKVSHGRGRKSVLERMIDSAAPDRTFGGGLLIYGSVPTIQDCLIEACGAQSGGGVAVIQSPAEGGQDSKMATLTQCSICWSNQCWDGQDRWFADKENKDGGGVYVAASSLRLTAVEVDRNMAHRGLGIYAEGSVLHFVRAKIHSNKNREDQSMEDVAAAQVLLEDCEVYELDSQIEGRSMRDVLAHPGGKRKWWQSFKRKILGSD
jgi:hypothetical protein